MTEDRTLPANGDTAPDEGRSDGRNDGRRDGLRGGPARSTRVILLFARLLFMALILATPALVGDKLYLRTTDHLWAFGK